jgi:serine/threonine protein kinase
VDDSIPPPSLPTLPLAAAEPALESELVADRYRVASLLGRGGMGDVYRARDLELDEDVALKFVRGASEVRALALKREIQLARRVTHPNVCRIYDFGVHREGAIDLPFLTMELLEGETLASRLSRGRLAAAALPIAEQVASALDAAHAAGVVHRDFKSANVILTGRRAVVTDFGLAIERDEATHALVGSPAYMAPEQVEGGAVTPATDVYAFGVVLYEMVTGSVPFDGGTPRDVAERRLRAPPPSPRARVPDLDPRWEAAILRCLRVAPSERFSSCGAAVRAIRARSWAHWIAAGALAVIALAATGYTLVPRETAGELVVASEQADYRSGELFARQALEREPSSRAAKLALARHLIDRSRLGSSRRSAALSEARAIAEALLEQNADDGDARDRLVSALYLAGDRLDALRETARLREPRRTQVAARIAWTAGWSDVARAGIARCLAADARDFRCLMIDHFEVELREGLPGIVRLLDGPSEPYFPAIARVRMRLLAGRIEEASLASEAGFARDELDEVDAPYIAGMIAAARGDLDVARHELAILERRLRDEDIPDVVLYSGAVQTAELAACLGDRAAVVRAARVALEHGFFNADMWERSVYFADYQRELGPIVSECRRRSARERAIAERRGLL